MKKSSLFFTCLFLFLLIGCSTQTPENSVKKFSFAAWTGGDIAETEEEWKTEFERLSSYGLTDLYLGAGKEKLELAASIGKEFDINIHAWIWTLNRPGDTTAAKHPDWYAVNRNGDNSWDYRAYVDYYQWLSPFSDGAREYIKSNIQEVATAKGVKSVHLDYVRYVDVILGADLQPKYDLVQDRQFPEFDYGYHPDARKGFKDIFDVDPMEMEHPELSTEWLQYRLNAVTSLVNELSEIAHQNDKLLTAAVFPFPEMSRQMVRQDWSNWELDIALPMLYHNFYRQNLEWIKFSTEQGIAEIDGRFDLVAGLYVPSLSPSELKIAIQKAKDGGAVGISVFNAGSMSDDHWKIVKEFNEAWN